MKFINLIAGPGATKSTGNWLLAGMLSAAGYRTEYLHEFAKTMTWQGNKSMMRDQIFMFANQQAQLELLREKDLDFVVVDGCLLNSLVYPRARHYPSFEPLVMEVFNSFENENFFIERVVPYSGIGRNETEEQARQVCIELEHIMARHQVRCYKKLPGNIYAPGEIFTQLTGRQPPLVVPGRQAALASQ